MVYISLLFQVDSKITHFSSFRKTENGIDYLLNLRIGKDWLGSKVVKDPQRKKYTNLSNDFFFF